MFGYVFYLGILVENGFNLNILRNGIYIFVYVCEVIRILEMY